MCGIAGILDPGGRLSRAQLTATAHAMARALGHRGPDDEGVWIEEDGSCALVHRRLSIIDTSSAGHQPMLGPDARHVLTFNGELYNFQELREAMAAAGEPFATRTDTEVFLAGLRREDAFFFTRADAMFAVGFYDRARRELLLGRDPFGEKPLYYTQQDGVFAFASELHALALLPGFDDRISHASLAAYLTFQHAPAPLALYDACRKLAPGHYLRVADGRVGEPTRYFHFLTSPAPVARSLDEQADQLEEVLVRSLRRRLIADVPLGAFLSGGLDSPTAVALITRRFNRSIQTFCIGFQDAPESEHGFAREIAAHLGTEHVEGMLDPASYAQLADLAARMDEPNADSSCAPTYLVSELARRSVTVAITGDGADELFGGYNRYFDCVENLAGREDDIAARRWHAGRDYYCRRVLLFDERDLAALFGEAPRHATDLLLQRRRRIDLDARPLIHRLREADVENYLPIVLAKVDRMSMLHGLESRTPYLTPEVAAFASALPQEHLLDGRRGKLVLRRVAERYLPAAWLARPKRGFGVEPTHPGISAALLARTRELLTAPDCRLAAWIPAEHLRRFVETTLPTMALYHAWALSVLEIWLRHHPGRPMVPAA